jgi:hypothetical protein
MHAVDTAGQLNMFLLEELAAVRMYGHALRAPSPRPMRAALTECKHSHERRCAALRETIGSLGGKASTPATFGRTWRQLEDARSAGSPAEAAISALERAERRMLTHYRSDMNTLDLAVRIFLEATLLEQQERTHRTLTELKKRFAGS